MEYMDIDHVVRVTMEDDKDFGKCGIIISKDGDFVEVNFTEVYTRKMNVSSLLDLTLKYVKR